MSLLVRLERLRPAAGARWTSSERVAATSDERDPRHRQARAPRRVVAQRPHADAPARRSAGARTAEVVRQRHAALAHDRGRAARSRRASAQPGARARAPRRCAAPARAAAGRRARRCTGLLAAARAGRCAAVGPGGPWAIPWPIVQCESGGQNLPPNCAGRVGLLPVPAGHLAAAWAARRPHAYQASEGRAGPARRPAVGRRRRRAQLGLRRARRERVKYGATGASPPMTSALACILATDSAVALPNGPPVMLTSARKWPTGGDWALEPKWDGYRFVAHVENGRARCLTRHGTDVTSGSTRAADTSASWSPGVEGRACRGPSLRERSRPAVSTGITHLVPRPSRTALTCLIGADEAGKSTLRISAHPCAVTR